MAPDNPPAFPGPKRPLTGQAGESRRVRPADLEKRGGSDVTNARGRASETDVGVLTRPIPVREDND